MISLIQRYRRDKTEKPSKDRVNHDERVLSSSLVFCERSFRVTDNYWEVERENCLFPSLTSTLRIADQVSRLFSQDTTFHCMEKNGSVTE